MRVLVTGAAGFLGSHLVDALLEQGKDVVGIDNFYTGSEANIAHLKDHRRFQFFYHDVRSPFKNIPGKLDEIWNLACPASPPKYQKDPVYTFMTSVQGVHNALQHAAKFRDCKVFQASTSEVYGDPAVHPQIESYFGNVNPVGIRSCYDESKRAAETLMTDFSKQYGVDIAIARIFNTYGPRMDKDDGRVVTNFIKQALRGEDITIYGTGTQTRSFCYVEDEIQGFLSLMESEIQSPVNIGNPGEFTMLELAELILNKTGSPSKLVYNELPGDDPKQRCPDITVAKRMLGWTPTIQLSDGLDTTIEYFRGKV